MIPTSCGWEPHRGWGTPVWMWILMHRPHPYFSYSLVVQFWEPSHLWDNTHQVVWIWGISCLISYLGMPTAHDQETLDQCDTVAPHAGRRETWVPLEAEFKCSLPIGVWREAPLSFSSIQKVSYTGHPEWAPRSFSDHSVFHQPLSFM